MGVTFTPAGFFPYGGLYATYVHDFQRLREFFPYDPGSPGALSARAEELEHLDRRTWKGAGGVIAEYNRGLGAPAPAVEAASLLARGRAVAVVAGQQAGFLGGPLFVLYKVLCALRLARRLGSELGRPVVAAFWVASEDHDWGEISWLRFVDGAGARCDMDLGPAPAGRVPAGLAPVPPGAAELLGRLAAGLSAAPAAGPLLEAARECLARASSVAHAFALLLTRLFGREGLVLVDPMLPGLRALSAPVWERALELGPGPAAAVARAGERVRQLGFDPGLHLEPEHALLFLQEGGERVALFWDRGRLWDREKGRSWDPGELLALARSRPERFSSNVVTRAVLQDHLLPTLAEVAGPGGIAYQAQLREAFAAFGRTLPPAFARLSLTLIPPAQAAVMEKHGLDLQAVMRGLEPRLDEFLGPADGARLRGLFSAQKARLEQQYRELGRELERLDPALGPLAETNLGRILHQVEYLEDKALHSHRRLHRRGAAELRRLAETVAPLGQPQERVLSAFPWLARYGTALIQTLLEGAPLTGEHYLAYLDD